jgi:hypothetical protein
LVGIAGAKTSEMMDWRELTIKGIVERKSKGQKELIMTENVGHVLYHME